MMRRQQLLFLGVLLAAMMLIVRHVGVGWEQSLAIAAEEAERALDERVAEARARLILPRPYLFVHVPKSGGTALGKLAELPENGGDHFIRFWHHPVLSSDVSLMLKHDFVFGHFKYGLHQHFLPQNCTYMTLLRDPVDRVLSHYYYHRSSTGDRYHWLAMRYPLEQWVDHSMDAKNDQTQFISGVYGVQTDKEFQMAMRHIETFGVVGIYERFEESVLLLKFYGGFHNLLYNHTKAVSDRPAITGAAAHIPVDAASHSRRPSSDHEPHVLEKIERANHYDRLLYNRAVEIFEAQIARVGPVFYEELARFRAALADHTALFGCVDCLQLNATPTPPEARARPTASARS